MDHLLANQDRPVPDAASVAPAATGSGEGADEDDDMKAAIALSQDGAEAKVRGRERCSRWEVGDGTDGLVGCGQSIKCSECGKIFKNTALAEFQ